MNSTKEKGNHQGRLEQSGSPEDLYLRPRTRFAASFLGHINWIGEAGLRPESIRLGASGRMRATLEHAMFLGNRTHASVRLGDGTAVMAHVARSQASANPGDSLWIDWRTEDEIRVP